LTSSKLIAIHVDLRRQNGFIQFRRGWGYNRIP